MSEYPIFHPIGTSITIYSCEDIEQKIRSLIPELKSKYVLVSEERFIKGLLIKYGYIDLTFQKNGLNQYLRVFGKTDKLGFSSMKKKYPKIKYQELINYFHTHFNDPSPLFPVNIEIVDCCTTDDPLAWLEKYFYV